MTMVSSYRNNREYKQQEFIQYYPIIAIKLDSEKDIKKEAKQLAKENNWDKLHTLLYLRTKYENENRAEEAAIVSKLIHEEEAEETMEYDGF